MWSLTSRSCARPNAGTPTPYPYPNPAGTYENNVNPGATGAVSFNKVVPEPDGTWELFVDQEGMGGTWATQTAYWDPVTNFITGPSASGTWNPATGVIDWGSSFLWSAQDEGWVEVQTDSAALGQIPDAPPDGVQVEYRLRNYNDEANTGPWTVLDPVTVTADTVVQPGIAEGYYVKRNIVILTAGTDNFNIIFQLDNDSTVADEAVAQQVFDLGDEYVDSRAYVLGVTKATTDHFVATTDAIYLALTRWASRWARAQGWLLRGATNDATDQATGQMSNMVKEAEEKIDELLQAKVDADEPDHGVGVFQFIPIKRRVAVTDEYSN